MTTILLSPTDLVCAAVLLLAEAGLSILLGLGLHRAVVVAALRMVVQLFLIGYVLRLIFGLGSPALVLCAVAVMTLVAAREVAARPKLRLRHRGNILIGAASVVSTTALIVMLALLTAIRPTPWWAPRYAIPMVGIVLGSVLNAASLSLDYVLDGAMREKGSIEQRLALGESFHRAPMPMFREAIRRGTLPIINQMSAAGIVTLPGIMTGQILAGADPIQSVEYQILLMFLLAGGSVMAAVVAAFSALRFLCDDRQRLRLDRLGP